MDHLKIENYLQNLDEVMGKDYQNAVLYQNLESSIYSVLKRELEESLRSGGVIVKEVKLCGAKTYGCGFENDILSLIIDSGNIFNSLTLIPRLTLFLFTRKMHSVGCFQSRSQHSS